MAREVIAKAPRDDPMAYRPLGFRMPRPDTSKATSQTSQDPQCFRYKSELFSRRDWLTKLSGGTPSKQSPQHPQTMRV